MNKPTKHAAPGSYFDDEVKYRSARLTPRKRAADMDNVGVFDEDISEARSTAARTLQGIKPRGNSHDNDRRHIQNVKNHERNCWATEPPADRHDTALFDQCDHDGAKGWNR